MSTAAVLNSRVNADTYYRGAAYDGSSMGELYQGSCNKADSIPTVHSLNPKGLNGPQLAAVATQAYKDTKAQTPITAFDIQCCPNPPPCQEEIAWRAAWKGCPYTYFGDEASQRCEVAPLGDRYWVADINPLLYERSLMMAAEQNPYNFMQARQLWMQFIMKDFVPVSDPYTRPIQNLDQSYCAQLATQGPPRYTTF